MERVVRREGRDGRGIGVLHEMVRDAGPLGAGEGDQEADGRVTGGDELGGRERQFDEAEAEDRFLGREGDDHVSGGEGVKRRGAWGWEDRSSGHADSWRTV